MNTSLIFPFQSILIVSDIVSSHVLYMMFSDCTSLPGYETSHGSFSSVGKNYSFETTVLTSLYNTYSLLCLYLYYNHWAGNTQYFYHNKLFCTYFRFPLPLYFTPCKIKNAAKGINKARFSMASVVNSPFSLYNPQLPITLDKGFAHIFRFSNVRNSIMAE